MRFPSTSLVLVGVLCGLLITALGACAGAEGGDELCDDDIDNDADGRVDCADPGCGLTNVCSPCGDGALDDAEACDDGNLTDGDGCSSRCALEGCGNGIINAGEACDDGNLRPGDGCSFRCQVDRCGDGVVNVSEQCDDGALVSGDGCSRTCTVELEVTCGNRRFDALEQCDDGNRSDGDGCSARCQAEFCGDGVVQPALGEQCEGTFLPDGSRCEGCRINRCGNGELDANEQCDDGNRFDGDGCSSFCTVERCGDFSIQAGEECEDGNAVSGDGCSATCQSEFCGDGEVQPRLGELCDDGPAAACDALCRPVAPCASLPSDDALCFGADVRNLQLVPRSVTLLARGDQTWIELASPQFGFAERQVVSPNMTLFPSYPRGPTSVFALDFNGDGTEEILASSFDSSVSVYRVINENTVGDMATYFPFGGDVFIPPLDVGGAALARDDAPDIFALSDSATLAVVLDPLTDGTTLTASLPPSAFRLVAAEGVVVAAAGTRLVPVQIDAAGTELVARAPVDVGAEIGDVVIADLDGDDTLELLVLTRAPDELLSFPLSALADSPLGAPSVLCTTPGGDRFGVGDVDDDGALDVVTASSRGSMRVHLAAEGLVASGELPAPPAATRPVIGDVNADGVTDIIVAGGFFSGLLVIYFGT